MDATDKFWDGKQIRLTDNTKKNIMKKAYLMDSELYVQRSGYDLAGEDAVAAMTENGISQDSLIAQDGTYSNMAYQAIMLLEQNQSQEARLQALGGLLKLGYTNIYDDATKEFLIPPKEVDDTPTPPAPQAPAPKEKEEKPHPYNPYYARSERIAKEVNVARQQQRYAPEPIAQVQQTAPTGGSNAFIESLRPKVGRAVVQREMPKDVVRSNSMTQHAVSPMGRVGLNPTMAARFGGRPMAPQKPMPMQKSKPMAPGGPSRLRISANPWGSQVKKTGGNSVVEKLGFRLKKRA